MKLALLKIANGPGFGNPFAGSAAHSRPHSASVLRLFSESNASSSLIGSPELVGGHVCGGADGIPAHDWVSAARATVSCARRSVAPQRRRFVLAQWCVDADQRLATMLSMDASRHSNTELPSDACSPAAIAGGEIDDTAAECGGIGAMADTVADAVADAVADTVVGAVKTGVGADISAVVCAGAGSGQGAGGTLIGAGAGSGGGGCGDGGGGTDTTPGASKGSGHNGLPDTAGEASVTLRPEQGAAALVSEVDSALRDLHQQLPKRSLMLVLAQGTLHGLADARGGVRSRDPQVVERLSHRTQHGITFLSVK